MACSENNATMNNNQSDLEDSFSEKQVRVDLPSFSSEEMMAQGFSRHGEG